VESLASWYLRVVADPDDEAPKEAFAAAVEARDPERAELIRLQLMTSRNRKARADSDLGVAGREGDLIRAHGARWAEPVSQTMSGWGFLRGFVEVADIDAEWFTEVADEIYAMAPILHLTLTDACLVTEDLFNSPQLARIKSISLTRNDFGDAEAAVLSRSPYLGNLEWLDLSHNRIGADGLEVLAASTGLPRLGYLDFRWNAAPDPTPRHADEYDATSTAALALQERYGPREWLDAHSRWTWPPERDSVWPADT
jgi:hypothetical protein